MAAGAVEMEKQGGTREGSDGTTTAMRAAGAASAATEARATAATEAGTAAAEAPALGTTTTRMMKRPAGMSISRWRNYKRRTTQQESRQ